MARDITMATPSAHFVDATSDVRLLSARRHTLSLQLVFQFTFLEVNDDEITNADSPPA